MTATPADPLIPSRPLSDRQERFVHEYLRDQNASAAAQRAGYSPKTRGAQAAELMHNPRVRDRIVTELEELYTRLKIDAYETLRAQANAAFFDPAKLFGPDGKPLPLEALDEQVKSALTISYDSRANGAHVLRVRQTPRHVALAALIKRYDQFQRLRIECDEENAHPLPPAGDAPPARPPAPPPVVLDLHRPDVRQHLQPAPADAEPAGQAAAGLPDIYVQGCVNEHAAITIPNAAPAALPTPLAQASPAKAPTPPAAPVPPVKRSIFAEALAVFRKRDSTPPLAIPASEPEKGASPPASAVTLAAKTMQPEAPSQAPPQIPDPTRLPAQALAQTDDYNFRKDPNWMWGGRLKPTPEPEPNPLILQAMADAKWREQNAELMGKHMKIRPGGVVAPTPPPPGYNPPHLRDHRPQYALGAGEFEWSWAR